MTQNIDTKPNAIKSNRLGKGLDCVRGDHNVGKYYKTRNIKMMSAKEVYIEESVTKNNVKAKCTSGRYTGY